MAAIYSKLSKEQLQNEFGRKYHYLVGKIGIQTTQIAAALDIDVSNLIGYANLEKPKSVSRDLILDLLKTLNRKFKAYLIGWVTAYPHDQSEEGAFNAESYSRLQARIDDMEIHQQAMTILLLNYMAETRGTPVESVQAELDKLKQDLAKRKYLQ